MCLRTITQRIDPPEEKERTAWKIMEAHEEGKYQFPHFGYTMAEDYAPFDRWLQATTGEIKTGSWNDQYPQGFHCLRTKEEARKYKNIDYQGSYYALVKVKVRGVHTIGTQGEFQTPVLVAKELYIPSPKQKEGK